MEQARRHDGRRPFVPVAVDPCGPDDYALEGTPIVAGPVALSYPSDRGRGYVFARARSRSIVQTLELYRDPAHGGFLRYLGGRYAIGWGGFLDELVRCP